MPEVLAPSLPFLWRTADGFPEADQSLSERMGVDIGQSGGGERIAENLTNRAGRSPRGLCEPGRCETSVRRVRQPGGREQGIVRSKAEVAGQHGDVLRHNIQ